MLITQKPNLTIPPIKYAKFMNTISLCVHDALVKLNTFIKKNLYNLLAHQHIYSSSLFMRNQFFNSCSNTWEANPSVPWQRAGLTNLVIKMKAPELKKKPGATWTNAGHPWHLPLSALSCASACSVAPIPDPQQANTNSRWMLPCMLQLLSSPLYPSPALPCFHVYAEVGLFLVPTKGLDY